MLFLDESTFNSDVSLSECFMNIQIQVRTSKASLFFLKGPSENIKSLQALSVSKSLSCIFLSSVIGGWINTWNQLIDNYIVIDLMYLKRIVQD